MKIHKDLIQKPVICVRYLDALKTRNCSNQYCVQQIVLYLFYFLLKLVYQIFVKQDLLFVERKNTSPFNRQGLFSVLIRLITGELKIGSHLLHQNFGT